MIPTIHHFWDQYGPVLWGPYGFNDGYNLGALWWGPDVIGIDLGPEIVMIENYLTGRTWERMMANPYVQLGLQRANFQVNTLAADPPAAAPLQLAATPNPFTRRTVVRFALPQAGPVRLVAFDVQGREVARLADGERAAGSHTVEWEDAALGGGVYFLRLEHGGRSAVERCVRMP